MTPQYLVERADLVGDRQEILAVWDRNGLNTGNPARLFDWGYANNPFSQGRIWLLRHAASDCVVGTAGVIPRRMKIGNSVCLAGRAAGFAIDKAHRSLGPGLMLQKAVLGDIGTSDIALVYTSAPPEAAPVFKRLNYRRLEALDCRRKVIGSAAFVENNFQGIPSFARKTFSWLMDWGIQAVSKETWHPRGKWRLTAIHGFDTRFDELWRRCGPLYSFTTERSADFLRWRFSDNPETRDYVCQGLCGDNGQLHGYTIYHIDEERVAHVNDLVAEDQGACLTALLLGLARQLRSSGVTYAYLSAYGGARFFEVLGASGFSKWRAPVAAPYQLFVSPQGSDFGQTGPGALEWGFPMADDFLDHL